MKSAFKAESIVINKKSTSGMRILHFTDSLVAGGKERQLADLLKGLSTYKDIVCELAIMSHDVHYTYINNFNIPIHYLIRKNKKDPRVFFKLYNLCKKLNPDTIHTWDSMNSVYAFPITKLLCIKLVNGMIRDAPARLRPFGKAWCRSKLTFPFSDVIVANSYAGIKSYRPPSSRTLCIHNGFDFERIQNLQDKEIVKAKYNIHTNKVVGMVASFSNNKDHETFIKAAEVILETRDDVTFLAIGAGGNLEKCKKLVKRQFQSKIKFLGKQKAVESIVNTFDIGVLATYSEGISNSIMEYMALGKPVVATDNEGTNELVLHGTTGFLVPPKNANDMSNRILHLLNNAKLAIHMGNAGRERIFEQFNFEQMTNSFVGLYRSLLTKVI